MQSSAPSASAFMLISAFRRVSVDAMMMARSGFFFRSCGSAVMPSTIGHLDVEHHHIRIDLLELIDRFAAVAQRSDQFQIRLRIHPALDETARHERVVDDHHADAARLFRLLAGFGWG